MSEDETKETATTEKAAPAAEEAQTVKQEKVTGVLNKTGIEVPTESSTAEAMMAPAESSEPKIEETAQPSEAVPVKEKLESASDHVGQEKNASPEEGAEQQSVGRGE